MKDEYSLMTLEKALENRKLTVDVVINILKYKSVIELVSIMDIKSNILPRLCDLDDDKLKNKLI